ncbi:MAG: hypothetical protein Q8Q07_06970 [Dehalococcoidales bacterium]|nr:hypothetical protein [Dehalococcoidales bacterium]
MPLYVIFGLSFLAIICIGGFVMPRISWWKTIEVPDRALAYLALFIGFSLLFQQVTEYNHGLVYVLSTVDARQTIDGSTINPKVIGIWWWVMVYLYWIFIASALLATVALFRGTVKDIRDSKAKDNTNQDNEVLKRLDRIIELLEK